MTFTLQPVDGASVLDDVTPLVGGVVFGGDYAGLDPVDGASAVSVFLGTTARFALDPVDGRTDISFRVVSDLADAPPISMGLFLRAHAILLPPLEDA